MEERQNRFTDHFGVVLALIILSLLVSAIRTDSQLWSAIATAVAAATLVTVFSAANARVTTMRIVTLIGLGAIIVSLTTAVGEPSTLTLWLNGVVNLLLVAVAPFVIGRQLMSHDTINGSTVAGALCIYLLIGLFFGIVYRTIAFTTTSVAFSGALNDTSVDYVYYSFVTLSTLGFGDITPATDLARMFTITEALLGQLYLVTVVAMLVSRVGMERVKRPRS